MLKEQTTTYAFKLKYLENPTFDRIRAFANTFINELPTKLTTELYDSLNRGTDLLDSEPSMLVYLYSFGKMHQAKLNYAFSNIPDGFMEQSEINIIDYGCGQAVGTMCYADYLKARGDNQKIKSITLIEPSEICLKRAALHASVFFPDAEITTINKKFDELDGNDISTSEDTPTLHILSNVLDLDFDLQKFSELIKSKLVGYNQFVCVDPYFGYSDKDQRMNKFADLIGGNISFSKILEKGELNPDKNWTCQTVILSVGELEAELSTEVTDEEIQNGITDEDGVVYSRDGKRLLKCGNRDLRNYEIRKGTEVICDEAFMSCSLASIVIPSSVTSIGNSAFEYCTSLESITIPSSVTSIGDSTFGNCWSLVSIVIPSSVTSIGNNAFWYCSSLKSITIPSSVTSIGDSAFYDCGSLESIVLSSSVTSIGYGVFSGCKLLREIKIIDNPLFVVDCDMLIDQKNMTLLAYFGIKSDVAIPSSVTSIGDFAFYDCGSLESIVFSSSVTSIGNNAFGYCSSLESIVLSSSVTSIGNNAFWYCSSLKSITIPSSVTSIGENAFRGCSSLESIVLSSSVTSIGDSALAYFGIKSDVAIPSSVTSIGDSAFYDCSSLKSITIPSSVTSIEDNAFHGCSSLESIVLSSSVTSIGNNAFGYCSSLESITIPSSVTSIGDGVFSDCKLLREIKIVNNPLFVVDCDMLIDQKNMKLLAYFGTKSGVTIPSSVTSIGDLAFSDCSSLKAISIPSSVTSIGKSAFENCRSLELIIITENSVEQFKGILPKDLWDKLYYLKKAVNIEESDTSDLP